MLVILKVIFFYKIIIFQKKIAMRNAIELIINRKYILYTSSLEEKNSWLKDLVNFFHNKFLINIFRNPLKKNFKKKI